MSEARAKAKLSPAAIGRALCVQPLQRGQGRQVTRCSLLASVTWEAGLKSQGQGTRWCLLGAIQKPPRTWTLAH